MPEGHEQRPDEHGGGAEGAEQDIAGRGDEGRRNAVTTPAIANDTEPGQTSSPAPPDDVGVPGDEEMNRPED